MLKNRYSIGGWFLTIILLLSGCNGDSSNSNEGGGGNDTPSVSLSAENVVLPAISNQQAQVNLKDRIQVRSDKPVPVEQNNYVSNVEPLDGPKACGQIRTNSAGFSIDTGNFIGVCSYKYDAASHAYPNLKTQAYSVVVLQNEVNGPVHWFSPISRTTTVNLPISINIGEEIKNEIVPGYTLSKDVSLFGSGSVDVDTATQTITYKPTKETEAGFVRLIYSYDNGVNVVPGLIVISLSEKANSAPHAPDINYSDFGNPQVNVNEEVAIDLSPYVSDPDGDAVQLIDVKSWNAAVTPVAPKDMDNLAFKFSSSKVGEHIVSYIISDHFGGYANGLVRIEVYDPNKAPPWGNIKMDDKLFWGPLTKSQADAKGIEFTGTHYEKDAVVATSVLSQAQQQCKPLGRLPTREEMRQLSEIHAGDVGAYNWPIELGYYAKNGSQVKVIDVTNGDETSTNADGQYVTCVTEGGFVVDESESVLAAIANGIHKAKVVAKITAGGIPVPGVSVFAKVQGDATLENSEAKTDENGLATFSLVSVIAGNSDVILSTKYLDATPSATVRFVADETTANISLDTIVDDQDADGGIDKVVATVVDSHSNPLPNLYVKFSSTDTVDIKPESVETDANGEIEAGITWNDSNPLEDVEAVIEGTYTTTLDTQIGDSTKVHFKGTNYQVVDVYQKIQGTIDSPARVCALVTKDGEPTSGVKVQWISQKTWVTPEDSETESNTLGEACTWFSLTDPEHHDEPVIILASVGSSKDYTNISFVEKLNPLITVELYEAGTDTSPAKVVAHLVDDGGTSISGQTVNWSSSVNWAEMKSMTSTTDDEGNAYNEVSLIDNSYLNKTLTIFGENSGRSGSTTFVFSDHSTPNVTIANMKVAVPGNKDLPATICADVMGLETVSPDSYDKEGNARYKFDWSVEPDWVSFTGSQQVETDINGHVCNSFKLNDPDKLYTQALATVKFRNLASSSLYFWFWGGELGTGEWVDDMTGVHYYQVAANPSQWMDDSDKDSLCQSVGYQRALDLSAAYGVTLRPLTPAYWSDIYWTTLSGSNAWRFPVSHRQAGVGKGKSHNTNHSTTAVLGKGNYLESVETYQLGNWVVVGKKVLTKSTFIICRHVN